MPIVNRIAAFDEDMKKWRRNIHQNPELGLDCYETASFIEARLREFGIDEIHTGIAKSGLVAIIDGKDDGDTIGLRADIDALPMTETTNLEYSSNNPGLMHACGHDGHTAMLIGAADILASKCNFDGTIIFIFQPNEENGLGAKSMLDEGPLSNLPIEEIYALHNLPGEPVGQLSTRHGLICSSESLFEIMIEGQSCHASMPQMGKDAILIGSEIVQTIQSIVSRKFNPAVIGVVSVTEFITDGKKNIFDKILSNKYNLISLLKKADIFKINLK